MLKMKALARLHGALNGLSLHCLKICYATFLHDDTYYFAEETFA